MKKLNILLSTSAISLLLLSGCATKVQLIDPNHDTGEQVMSLDYRDFNKAASTAVQSMLKSPALDKKDGKRFVLVISNVENDTMQHIDTDQLIKRIRIELLNSGKVFVTTALGSKGNVDEMNTETRELVNNKNFKQSSIAKQGTLIAPDMSLSGKILQKNIGMSDDKQQVEYYFMLTLTDIKTGFAVWEGETFIGKRGSAKSVAW
jgi:hypothetical protein